MFCHNCNKEVEVIEKMGGTICSICRTIIRTNNSNIGDKKMKMSILSSKLIKVSQNASIGFWVSLILAVLLINQVSYSQTKRIFDYTNKPTPDNTDGFVLSEADHDYFYTTWLNMKNTLKASTMTWTPIQYFNGAVFNAGTHGSLVTNDTLRAKSEAYFEDPVWFGDYTFAYLMWPYSTMFWSQIGSPAHPYRRMYAQQFVIVNSSLTDSARLYYDAGQIYSDYPLSVKLNAPDSAASNIGDIETPYDTIYAQGIVSSHNLNFIAQNEGSSSLPPDSIWKYGVVIKPGINHYTQTYTPNASTTSLRVKSEVINLNAGFSGGVCDTLYIGQEIASSLGRPIITIYNQGTNTFTITDTDGAGYNYCIRLPGTGTDITLGQYDSVRLWFDANKTQWVYFGSADNN